MSRTPTTADTAASRAFRQIRTDSPPEVFDPTERRHPRFNLFEKHWRFLHESYVGGPEYLYKGLSFAKLAGEGETAGRVGTTNLFKYFKEGSGEYTDRLLRSHRNNYSKKVVDQIKSFVAKKPPTRRWEDASESVKRFWKNADGLGRSIDRTMSTVLQWAEVFGVTWMMVDKPHEVFLNNEDELDFGLPYIKHYFPFDVLDGGFTDRGVIKWVMVRDFIRKDDDALAAPALTTIFTIWDRNRFTAIRKAPKPEGSQPVSQTFLRVPELSGEHNLGVVPIHPVRFSDSEDPFISPGLIDDIAYLDRDIFNKQSQLDTIVLDQTFSQLTMPADAVIMNSVERAEQQSADVSASGSTQQEARERIVEMGTKRVFLFNGNASHPPRYISPDASQVDAIRQIIKDETTEIYRIAGLLGEVGREVRTQSGTSKAYDFDRLNKVLSFAAGELEFAEWWAAMVASLWLSLPGDESATASAMSEDLVSYPDTFDITGLLEELDVGVRAEEFDYWSPTARAELRKKLLQKQFPSATDKLLEEMFAEVDERLKKEKVVFNRVTDPDMDPDMDPNRPDDRLSDIRGRGGGARQPGAGPPTRPDRQTAGSADREEDDDRPSR